MSSQQAPPPGLREAAIEAQRQLTVESFTLFSVAVVVVLIRTYARAQAVGLKKLQADDYLVWFAMICYGTQTGISYLLGVTVNKAGGGNLSPEQRAALNPKSEEYNLRVLIAQLPLALWVTYDTTLWALKAALLVFSTRLTAQLGRGYKTRIYLGWALIVASYVIIIMNTFLSCRPFNRFWQISPDPSNVCHAAVSRTIIIVLFVCNVSTDLYLLTIPIPMLWTVKLRLLKKIGLMCLLSGGALIVVFATLRCVLVLNERQNGGIHAGFWAARESFTAVVTTNIPAIYPLIHRWNSPVTAWFTTVRSSHKFEDAPKSSTVVTIGGSRGMPKGHRWKQQSSVSSKDDFFNESEEHIMEGIRMQDRGTP